MSKLGGLLMGHGTPSPTIGPGHDHAQSHVGLCKTTPNSMLAVDASMPSPTLGSGTTTPNSILGADASTPSPTLGQDTSVPSFLLGFRRELSPIFLRSGVKLKGHSTLSPPYPEPELIIMMPIKYEQVVHAYIN
jgi:hypothetical protein